MVLSCETMTQFSRGNTSPPQGKLDLRHHTQTKLCRAHGNPGMTQLQPKIRRQHGMNCLLQSGRNQARYIHVVEDGHNQMTEETKWKSGLLTAVTPDGTSERKICITYNNIIMSQRFGNRNKPKDKGKQKKFTVACKSDAKRGRHFIVLRKTMKDTWIRLWHLCDWVSEWVSDLLTPRLS
jgi:hypothetical protein